MTVMVTDSDGNTTSQDVTVTVTNEPEMGEVMLSARQPEVGVPITASITDADGGVKDVEWQWSYQNWGRHRKRNCSHIHARHR